MHLDAHRYKRNTGRGESEAPAAAENVLEKGHFHGHEHTCTHTRRQSAQTPTFASPESEPDTGLTFCAV